MKNREVIFRVVAPTASPNGKGWDDVKVMDCYSYEQAEEYIEYNNLHDELRIDKVFVLKKDEEQR